MAPGNDNDDPLKRPDTALTVLYQARRELLAADTAGQPLWWWRERQWYLAQIERYERICLEYL